MPGTSENMHTGMYDLQHPINQSQPGNGSQPPSNHPILHLTSTFQRPFRRTTWMGPPRCGPKDASMTGFLVHHWACMHSNQSPSKLDSDRSNPLVENFPMGAFSLGIQYDTGFQLSLISQSTHWTLPTSMYFRGTSSKAKVMNYAVEGKIILINILLLIFLLLQCVQHARILDRTKF